MLFYSENHLLSGAYIVARLADTKDNLLDRSKTTIETQPGSPGRTQSRSPAPVATWPVLVVESVHLLGLVLSHAQNSRNAVATTALFDHFTRQLNLLRKMPDQDGELLVFRNGEHCTDDSATPSYTIAFGSIVLPEPSPNQSPHRSKDRTSQLWKTLNQAFKFFEEQAIHSFCLRLPNESARERDQLRLALNIAARYRKAADTRASITFRYFGRVVNVPLVYNDDGRPDPNLTIVAGLNGLSAINVRSMIRQADAICRLVGGDEKAPCPQSAFEQVFSLRNLRTHLIKPFIEVNTRKRRDENTAFCGTKVQPLVAEPSSQIGRKDSHTASTAFGIGNLETQRTIQPLLEVVLSDNYADIDAQEMGRRLLYASKLLSDFKKANPDSDYSTKLLQLLKEKFEHAPELLVKKIKLLRSGLKISGSRKALVIGLIHPELLDLIALVRDRLLSEEKYESAKLFNHSMQSNDQETLRTVADLFGFNVAETRSPLGLFSVCSDSTEKLCSSLFTKRIQGEPSVSHSLFEILWYLFKIERIEQDSITYLQLLKQASTKLIDKKAGIRLLMTDLLQTPLDVIGSDRFALLCATIILRTRSQEKYSDIDHTPFEVLRVKRGLITEIQDYTANRLEFDQVAILTKMRTIYDRLRESLRNSIDDLAMKECRSLLSLEREALLFSALVGGDTARMVLCGVFSQYEGLIGESSQRDGVRQIIQGLLDNLHIAVKGLQRVGQWEDLDFLKQLDNTMTQLRRLDESPEYNQSVQRLLARIESAVKSIQLHSL
jgi:hypothetical protein